MNWNLTPPTLCTWASIYASQWDYFVQTDPLARPFLQQVGTSSTLMDSAQESYVRYRQLMQIIDTLVLDARTLQYKQRVIVAAVMYILFAVNYAQVNKEMVSYEYSNSSKFLLQNTPYNSFFGCFVKTYFNFDLSELLPTIQYVAPFWDTQFSYDLPTDTESITASVQSNFN